MDTARTTRRELLQAAGGAAAALALPRPDPGEEELLALDPAPLFPLPPGLFMQFMEPLGTTDGSVEAAWDHGRDRWRPDVVEAARRLAPTLLRWGGCLSSYYRWREGVGPREARRPMLNLCWGGVETNQVGTHEFVDFARQVGASPFYGVNFEADGRPFWGRDPKGSLRTAGPEEAAEWVAYCNRPDHPRRRQNGAEAPFGLKLWQLGNETSYDRRGYDVEKAALRTVAFARAMRAEDPELELIGWGDSGWAKRMAEIAGEHIQYLAFHHMFHPDGGDPDTPLRGNEYRKDPDRTWASLMKCGPVHEARIRWMREQAAGTGLPLALTECHLALPGRNRCEVLSSWAAAVAYARVHHAQERHGDALKIATMADFCGTRWQVNAVMIPVPGGRSFLMPVAQVMALYRRHRGERAVRVTASPDGLDVTASVTSDRVYFHVANTLRTRAVAARIHVPGREAQGGRVFELAADPGLEVLDLAGEVAVAEKALPPDGRWTFPPASVTAVEWGRTA